jgi:hypothetical protein
MIERASSPCTAALAPETMFQSIRQSFGGKLPQNASPELRRACAGDGTITPPEPAAQQTEDRSTLCLLFCCCNKNPSIGALGAQLKQQCVADSLNQVDRDLGYQSRYKAEISYNMTTNPPSPLMHRDFSGADTTQPSTNWIGRIYREIEGFTRASGHVRRPDVVVVNNPAMPPVQSNIAAIYEMKFPGDPENEKQMQAYNRIIGQGRKATLLDEENCDCGRRQQEVAHRLAMAKHHVRQSQILNAISHLIAGPVGGPLPVPEPLPFPLPP